MTDAATSQGNAEDASSRGESFGASAPEPFQLSGSGIGELPGAVDLFHGDVSLSRTLVSLPVRDGEDSPISVEVVITYGSNVAETVRHSNLTNPTGALGVGWDLPVAWIEASSGEPPASGTRTYTLRNGGDAQNLVQEAAPPFLFTMPAIDIGTFANDTVVPANIVDAFSAHGLQLASSAIMIGEGPWRIVDAVNRQEFVLKKHGGDSVHAYDGGESFQSRDYAFSKIIYYPAYERWVVTDRHGIRREFGGTSDPAEQGCRRKAYNNSIGWQVWWTDSTGAPAWTGPSDQISGQIQVARTWYLATIRNTFGDTAEYYYDQEVQPIGSSGSSHGLEYTRAVHLSKIVDSYGRAVSLTYGDKLWADDNEAPREYVDPFGEHPVGPRVFQPFYATRYLQKLDIAAQGGELMYRINMHYDPRPDQSGRDREVANLTDTTGRLKGNTYKRFLTAVTMENRDGVTRPGINFAPYLTQTGDIGWSGAMRAITFPEGATAHYDYLQQSLTACKRNTTLPSINAIPRVFFGSDYTATCRYNPSTATLSLRVEAWSGRWLPWLPFGDKDGLLLDGESIDLNSLSVAAGEDTLVVRVDRPGPVDTALFVFQRDPLNPELWVPAVIDGATAAMNSPTLTFDRSSHDISLSSGDAFFTVTRTSWSGDGTLYRYSYDEMRHNWQSSPQPVSHYTNAVAGDDYYVLFDRQGKLRLTYRDGKRIWHESETSLQLDVGLVDRTESLAIVPGGNVLAITHLANAGLGWNNYQLFIVSWGDSYKLRLDVATSFEDEYSDGQQLPGSWWPHVIQDTMIGVAWHLFRYNGSQWLENSSLRPATPQDGRQQRYAYARDYAVLMIQPPSEFGTVECHAVAYDPVQHSGGWTAESFKIDQAWSHDHFKRDNWPRLGHDFAVIGPYLYYRGQAINWEDVFKSDPQDLRQTLPAKGFSLDSASLVNAGPDYIAYRYLLDDNVQGVQFVILGDGGEIASTTTLHGETLASPQDDVGGPRAASRMLVTYPASAPDFDQAHELSLHRYTHGAVTGLIHHNAVKRLRVDDGFGRQTSSSWVFDPNTAGCGPSGIVAKYYRTTAYPGASDPEEARFGRTEKTFYNGVGEDPSGSIPLILDGIWKTNATYDADGNLRRYDSNNHEVIRSIAVATPNGWKPQALAGGFPVTTTAIRENLGVRGESTYGYIPDGFPGPIDGTPVSTATSYVDARNQIHHVKQQSRLAAPLYPALVAIHRLAPRAQVLSQRRRETESTWLTETAFATTFTTWKSGNGPAVPATEASFSYLNAEEAEFPFDQYQPGNDAPPGWVLKQRITRREPKGQSAEARGPEGVPNSTLFDADALFAIAHCANVEVNGFAFRAFEPYESTVGWTAQHLTLDPNDAMMGAHSGRLSVDGYLSTAIKPRRAETYVVGCWYKTPAGSQPATGTDIVVTVRTNGSSNTHRTQFAATDGAWQYLSVPVPLDEYPTDSASIQLDVQFANAGPQDLWLDGVRIVPLVCQFQAVTLDRLSRVPTAITDQTGSVHRIGLDRNFRPTVGTDVQSGAVDVTMRFRSRQGNANGQFDADSPNAELSIIAANGGSAETFRDGGEWQHRWQPTALSSWRMENGSLVHVQAGLDQLAAVGGLPNETFAAYFELQTPSSGDLPTVSIQAGNVTIGFSDGQYHASQENEDWTALAQPPFIARHWMLVVGSDVTFFFGDGQLLFSERKAPSGADLKLVIGGSGTTIRNLSLLHGARMSLAYLDALDQQRQMHTLEPVDGAGDDTVVSQTVRDDLGRVVANTKLAPGSFGTGAARPVAAYRPDFVDVNAFLQRLDGDRKMSGIVSDYYSGQTADGISRPDDDGYPYGGKRYLAEPSGAVVELGQPGARHAINLLIPASKRETIQQDYQSAESIAAEAAGAGVASPVYFKDELIRPSKNRNVTFKDKRGAVIARLSTDAGGTLLTQSETTQDLIQTSNDGPWSRSDMALPNAFLKRLGTARKPNDTTPPFHRIVDVDAMGRQVRSDMPDAATADTVHDNAGRGRFHRPPQDSTNPWFIYIKYDVLGREIERGVVHAEWDRDQLAKQANNPSYPDFGNLVRTRITYDGDGKVAHQIGQVQRIETVNPAESGAAECTVIEQFTYTPAGEVASVTTNISGAAQAEATISYTYNAVSEVIRIDLPDNAPMRAIHYTRDAQGRISAIGRTRGGTEFGKYRYTVDGTVALEKLAGGIWRRTTARNSAGHIESITAGLEGNANTLAFYYEYDPDGLVSSRKVEDRLGKLGRFEQRFGYDALGRYHTGVGTNDIGCKVETDLQYDANGNILDLAWSNKTLSFKLASGYDRLESFTENEKTSTFEFDAAGRMTLGLGREISYDQCHGKTRKVAMSATENYVTFAYGGNDRRILKQSPGSKIPDRVYIFGNEHEGKPLLIRDGDDWQVLVPGPLGLVALCHKNVCHYPLCDALGSTWALVDDQKGLLASFAYSPYGRLTFGSPLRIFPYLFQGREWDDETRLYNFDARLYDPDLCRFIAPDPAHQFPSPYIFLGNAPLNFIDPTGTLSTAQIITGVVASVIVLAAVAVTALTMGAAGAPALSLTFFGWTLASAIIGGVGGAAGSVAAYAFFTPEDDFSAKNAAISGAIGFGMGFIVTPLSIFAFSATDALAVFVAGKIAKKGIESGTRIALNTFVGSAIGSAQSGTEKVFRNLATGEDPASNIWFAAVAGGTVGGLTAGLGAVWRLVPGKSIKFKVTLRKMNQTQYNNQALIYGHPPAAQAEVALHDVSVKLPLPLGKLWTKTGLVNESYSALASKSFSQNTSSIGGGQTVTKWWELALSKSAVDHRDPIMAVVSAVISSGITPALKDAPDPFDPFQYF